MKLLLLLTIFLFSCNNWGEPTSRTLEQLQVMEYTLDSLGIHGQLIGVDEFTDDGWDHIHCDVDSTVVGGIKTYTFRNMSIPPPQFGNVIPINKGDTLWNLMARWKLIN